MEEVKGERERGKGREGWRKEEVKGRREKERGGEEGRGRETWKEGEEEKNDSTPDPDQQAKCPKTHLVVDKHADLAPSLHVEERSRLVAPTRKITAIPAEVDAAHNAAYDACGQIFESGSSRGMRSGRRKLVRREEEGGEDAEDEELMTLLATENLL